jgi:hypothetical protein
MWKRYCLIEEEMVDVEDCDGCRFKFECEKPEE